MILKIIFSLLLFATTCFASKTVQMVSEQDKSYVKVYLENKNLFDITYSYTPSYKNLLLLDDLATNKSQKAKSRKLIATYKILENNYQLKNKYAWVLGNKRSIHKKDYLYSLPFRKGSKVHVSQGFNGKFSHQGNSLYAIDFSCKVGTKIYSSRAGQVVSLKNNGYLGGMKKSFSAQANYVTLKHNDGTYGKYAHLKKGGVKVKLGQKIKKGQFLGYSGNTGYVSGPHLHFVVFKAKDNKSRESLKIRFKTQEGILSNPIRGKTYTVYKDINMNQAIKNLAILAINSTLNDTKLPSKEDYVKEFPLFKNKAASFITLKQKGRLRGCIGSLVAHRDLYDDIVHNAKSAAFKDPRFSPLKQEDLKLTTLEVSILSQAILLKYDGLEDLKSKVKPGKHGVILKYEGKQATFLPQVWDELKTFDIFFEHLCQKAKLPIDCLKNKPSIYLYEVQKIK